MIFLKVVVDLKAQIKSFNSSYIYKLLVNLKKSGSLIIALQTGFLYSEISLASNYISYQPKPI